MSRYAENASRGSRSHYNFTERRMLLKPFYVFFYLGSPLTGKYAIVHASSLEKARTAAKEKYPFIAAVMPELDGIKEVKKLNAVQLK